MDNWDFKRDRGGKPGFEVVQRPDGPENFRLLGQLSSPQLKNGVSGPSFNSPDSPEVSPLQFNSYNRSVRVISADAGPAPWDQAGTRYKKLFIMGEVAAGRYDVTVAYSEPGSGVDADFVLVDPASVKVSPKTFALRVRGTSMIENGIENGDIILVQAQDWAEDGDFVIACLAGSSDPLGFVTLKRFYKNRVPGRVVLQPANQSLNPSGNGRKTFPFKKAALV